MGTNKSAVEDHSARDLGFYAIVTFVAVIAGWLLLMPFVPSIAQATINRFHLRTGSFTQWAIQQPIPAMYNMANRYQITQESESGPPEVTSSGTVNHFPVRVVTFADGRYLNLRNGGAKELRVTSSYRDQSQSTVYRIVPAIQGGFELRFIPELEDSL